MCGIAGIVSADAPVDLRLLASMRDLMRHRGPDGAGLWSDESGKVALAHRRLAIIDLSERGSQPMEWGGGRTWIVFNGEIYNYLELRDELKAYGYTFCSDSDTEVILAGYAHWGEEVLSHLNGMFAFAIWDTLEKRLFMARDRFGEKPLYYAQVKGAFVFASEMKSLLHHPSLERRTSRRMVYRYLMFGDQNVGKDTFYDGIWSLEPAHAMIVDSECKQRAWRYWDIDAGKKLELGSDAAYAECFRNLLQDSVRLRLRSDVEVGTSLSGGLDSSSIVCLMHRILATNGKQKSFSGRFRDCHYDEGRYIEEVIRATKIRGCFTYPEGANIPNEIDDILWYQEEPFLSTSVYAQWCVMRLARDEGVTVLLDGQGADEILAGYDFYLGPYLRELLRKHEILRAFWTMVRQVCRSGFTGMPIIGFYFISSSHRKAFKKMVRPLGIHGDLDREFGNYQEIVESRFGDLFHDELYDSCKYSMLPKLLRYADRNSMAFSREIRLPFLDHRLVEMLFASPIEQKVRLGRTKIILRCAMKGIIPEAVLTREDKMGFETPERDWSRGVLRDWMGEIINSGSLMQRGWLDRKVVKRVWYEHSMGLRDLHSILWRWITLELWSRLFIDRHADRAPACTDYCPPTKSVN